MTDREKAIKMLKSKMDGHTDTSYEWAETVRIAIKALEQNVKYRKEAKRWKNKALEQEPINNGWIPYSERERKKKDATLYAPSRE